MRFFKKKTKKMVNEMGIEERSALITAVANQINDLLTAKIWNVTENNPSFFMTMMEVLTLITAHTIDNILANTPLTKAAMLKATLDSITAQLDKAVAPEPELVELPPRKNRK